LGCCTTCANQVRRRKLLVEQQAARAASEQAADTESILEVLVKQSAEEQKLGQQLWQVKQEKVHVFSDIAGFMTRQGAHSLSRAVHILLL